MDIVLEGRKMKSREAFHDEIESKLDTPDYYGRNLDALYDVLTESDEANIILNDVDDMLSFLGSYGDAALEIFKEAEEYNDNLVLIINH